MLHVRCMRTAARLSTSCAPPARQVRRLLDGRGVQRLLECDSSGAMLALSATDAAGPNPPEFQVTQLQLQPTPWP